MGIDLRWCDDRGAELDRVDDRESHFAGLIERIREMRQFPVLASIDPYGTTRFTPPQVTRLLQELEIARTSVSIPEHSITVGHYLTIIRAAEGDAETWLEFIGD